MSDSQNVGVVVPGWTRNQMRIDQLIVIRFNQDKVKGMVDPGVNLF